MRLFRLFNTIALALWIGSLLAIASDTYGDETTSENWRVEIFNVDDEISVLVNGITVGHVSYQGYKNISLNDHLTLGENTLTLLLKNTVGPWTYGYKIWKDSELIHFDRCGEVAAGDGISTPCRQNNTDIGTVWGKDFTISQSAKPLYLVLEREAVLTGPLNPFSTSIGLPICWYGKLYKVEQEQFEVDLPLSLVGEFLAHTMEPVNLTASLLQARISPGKYLGFIREDGPKGWRIDLNTDALQIHIGNFLPNSKGCVLVGTTRAAPPGCAVLNSAIAITKIEAAFESIVGLRPVHVHIKE